MSDFVFPEHGLIYHIDKNDRLCSVSEDWSPFALANDGSEELSERVLGRSLWDFIEDTSVRELYRQMVHRARSGHPAQFDYRCDAPECRRQFHMTIRAVADGRVEFLSQLVWKQERPRVGILDIKIPRNEHWVRVCSWCQNFVMPDGSWVSVEDAVEQMDLMAEEALPMLTHGICPSCHSGMLAQLAAVAPCEETLLPLSQTTEDKIYITGRTQDSDGLPVPAD